MSFCLAQIAVGGGVNSIPRPFFSSGDATTTDGKNPAEESSSNTMTERLEEPKNANLGKDILFFRSRR